MNEKEIADPLTHEALPCISEKGAVTGVILDLDRFQRWARIVQQVVAEDEWEAEMLAQSPTFRTLTEKGIEEIETGQTHPWQEVFDEL